MAAQLNNEEREAFDQLIAIRNRIVEWGLEHNIDELDHGVHTVAQFIVQRMLHRENPDDWGAWFHE